MLAELGDELSGARKVRATDHPVAERHIGVDQAGGRRGGGASKGRQGGECGGACAGRSEKGPAMHEGRLNNDAVT